MRAIEDRLAIEDVIIRYARGVDDQDDELVPHQRTLASWVHHFVGPLAHCDLVVMTRSGGSGGQGAVAGSGDLE